MSTLDPFLFSVLFSKLVNIEKQKQRAKETNEKLEKFNEAKNQTKEDKN